jgi:IS30 family transposase
MQAIFSSRPMERLVIDFTELPFCHLTDNRWILVVVDHFSSFVWMRCFPSKHTVPVAQALLGIVADQGSMELVASDNGKEFVSEIIKVCGSIYSIFPFFTMCCLAS